jgi:MoaA/NifB/PqqE/SkfB family radical SAM enzyme
VSLATRVGAAMKGAARGVVGAVSPRLLRRIQLSRARSRYLQEPTSGPRRLLLEPTTGCNHRCEMCWDHSPRLGKPTPSWHMPFDRVRGLMEEMAAMGTEEVWLAGRGEPLVHPRADDILQLIGSLGMRSIITTNAGRLTEELADCLQEWGVQQLSVSIDSGTAETYGRVHHARPEERARILGLIRRLSEREDRPRLLASMVLSKLNCAELADFARDAIEAGASGIVVGGMRPVPFDSTDLALSDGDWARVRDDLGKAEVMAREAGIEVRTDNIQPAESQRAEAWPYADMGCFIGHMFAVIDVHGNVDGCCTCQNKLGSLEDASFREIWWGRPYQYYRRALREMPNTGLTPPQCECRYGCGHIPENAALQRELEFEFARQPGESEFATRMDVASGLCAHLDALLPAKEREFAFADLREAGARETAARLRQVGVMAGIGSMDGVSLFEPQRLVARGEFEETTKRALTVSGIESERADALVAQSRAGEGHPAEPLTKRDMAEWLSGVREAVSRG